MRRNRGLDLICFLHDAPIPAASSGRDHAAGGGKFISNRAAPLLLLHFEEQAGLGVPGAIKTAKNAAEIAPTRRKSLI